MIPTSRRSSAVIGTPEMLYWSITSRARPTVADGGSVTGSMMIPLALRLTLSTSSACRSIDRFLWITPRPPSWESAMAISLSVTVSIGELTSGIFSWMPRVSRVLTSTSDGTTAENRGTKSTSSNVMPVETIFPSMRPPRRGKAADYAA